MIMKVMMIMINDVDDDVITPRDSSVRNYRELATFLTLSQCFSNSGGARCFVKWGAFDLGEHAFLF